MILYRVYIKGILPRVLSYFLISCVDSSTIPNQGYKRGYFNLYVAVAIVCNSVVTKIFESFPKKYQF